MNKSIKIAIIFIIALILAIVAIIIMYNSKHTNTTRHFNESLLLYDYTVIIDNAIIDNNSNLIEFTTHETNNPFTSDNKINYKINGFYVKSVYSIKSENDTLNYFQIPIDNKNNYSIVINEIGNGNIIATKTVNIDSNDIVAGIAHTPARIKQLKDIQLKSQMKVTKDSNEKTIENCKSLISFKKARLQKYKKDLPYAVPEAVQDMKNNISDLETSIKNLEEVMTNAQKSLIEANKILAKGTNNDN